MEVFSKIQTESMSFFDHNSSGRVLTRATNDIEAISELFTGVIISLFKDVFMIIGIVIVMLSLDVKMALVSFVVIPIIIGVTYWYNKYAKPNFRVVRTLVGSINAFFAENISGMRLVQIFNRERQKFAEFETLNDEYNKASILGVKLNAVFRPVSEFINSLAISLLIWYAAGGTMENLIGIGVLNAFVSYSKKFFAPINDLADNYTTIQSSSVSAERIFEILDENETNENIEKGRLLTETKGCIEFKNVWFCYVEGEWVLRDVSFKINTGETVAFVGATGAGKSTIINLMGRFYEIQKGQILLDGVDIKEYSLKSLRKHIAVVMQDVFLFSGDIKYNIRLNNTDIDGEEIVEAARYVNADPFISELPGGYDEIVTERGSTLSAGQRQLLSFARAVAFKPSILVLDEATANIDTENEMIIQESLEKISKDRTTLIIAHRLSTIKKADQIIVIHKGKVREIGTHDALLAKEGFYKRLYDMQFA
ncbi:atp-binding cassette sub-family b [Holotrichia oblita]|nr:atp-binding cassette sub-family b [Holotrichia oblita]